MTWHFDWDEQKAHVNTLKHEVSFEEAQTVFFDPFARILVDESHSQSEVRFLIFGHSSSGRLLVVCYTETDSLVRIISARRLTKEERRRFESYWEM